MKLSKWEEIYNIFKGEDWPECPPENDFYLLPEMVKNELINVAGYDPLVRNSENYVKKFICDGETPLTVFYTTETDGGGTWFGQDYISIIKLKYPNKKFDKVFEWCAGPAFIGFSLMSHNLCNKLCVNDLHNPAIDLVDMTIKYNNCEDKVSSYLLKDIGLLPSHEMFDLVVSNPPHFKDNVSIIGNNNRICTDLDWKSHENFYRNIGSHLSEDGVILIQENSDGSSQDDFEKMINNSGLKITNLYESVASFYFLEVKHK